MDSVLASSAHPHCEVRGLVAGVDEAGRGCLAGPVVAACVVFPCEPAELPDFIRDSKKLSAPRREEACRWVYRNALAVSVGLASVEEIDRWNILQASLLAMRRAIERTPMTPDIVLIDGMHVPDGLPCSARAVVDGDAHVPVISAASIVAKVVRDHLMEQLHWLYPHYGFAQHKGYGTAQHRQAISQFGLSPQHRRSFCTRLLHLPFGEGDG